MSVRKTVLDCGDVLYRFGDDGFPESVKVKGFHGAVYPVSGRDFGRVHIQLSDGRELVPYCEREPEITSCGEGEGRTYVVEYGEILWCDTAGNRIPNFRLSLRYELLTHGRAFVNAFFVATDMHSPDIDKFDVDFELETGAYPEARWALVPRPKVFDASMIQSMRSGRNLPRGEERHIDGEISPDVSVNVRAGTGECSYFEILMEGENSISGDKGDCMTDIGWSGGNLRTTYSFVRTKPCRNKLMQLWQWRNQWGWVLKTAYKTRHLPPIPFYHYFDNYLRYPTDECINNLAKAGAKLLVLHENWRFDLQNDGIPFDAKELKRVVEKAHKCGMRIALYIRGNEISACDDACPWFDRYLKRDFDGLYMDYGGPFHESHPDEAFPGGRVPLKNYMLRMQALRNRIGENGVFFGHTGTCYSAVWYASCGIDGYVSGEGEGGVMVRSREDHEYFSMAAVSPGTMWTGAFPAYSTSKMRPFLAATGQSPHNPLGEQFKTSSLAHPREPGVNDHAFRPLWKIWHFFDDETELSVYNDYNSFGVFDKTPDIGHYLMVSKDRRRMLLVVSNFEEKTRTVEVSFDPALCGLKGFTKAYGCVMTPTEKKPGKAVFCKFKKQHTLTLGPNDVAAVYYTLDDTEEFHQAVARFEKSYPALSKGNQQYLNYLAEQRKFREQPAATKELYLTLTVPNTNLSYEYSLCYDLYYNSMALVEFLPDGTKKRLGWISQKGFVKDEPGPDDYIWPDVISPKIPLHEILGPGRHFIGIESVHYGGPFYSFLSAELTPDNGSPYTIYFMNELEPDREYLRWNVNIID